MRYNVARQNAAMMKAKVDRLEMFVNRLKAEESRAASSTNAEISEGSVDQVTRSTTNLKISGHGSTLYVAPSHWESIIEDVRWSQSP